MNDIKKEKALALYCSIGMISDDIVAQCQSPRYQKRLSLGKRKWLIAASVALVITIGAVVNASLFALLFGSSDAPVREETPTLADTLQAAESQASLLKSEKDYLFGGSASIIWQSEQDGKLYALSVPSGYEEAQLKQLLASGGTQLSQAEAEEISTRLWISYGDGTVVTPYLKSSAGNVYYGKLFDYTAELDVGEDWAEFISELI